ncbi:C4-type zinc finger domain-containing protein [Pseudomonas phage EM]|uniref:C4-type zinc finger domain-containing protein n=1 Tax=Pseudomonas phage EM TaxID=2936914 RepID=A0AAE9HG40_9CAUD|nr:C4-type zinc finger domain-containing protein [Pseudomonas phage EM]UPW35903.1 C4-type zinc finger domain-containing protein [Pseudomonas phage EM]
MTYWTKAQDLDVNLCGRCGVREDEAGYLMVAPSGELICIDCELEEPLRVELYEKEDW